MAINSPQASHSTQSSFMLSLTLILRAMKVTTNVLLIFMEKSEKVHLVCLL